MDTLSLRSTMNTWQSNVTTAPFVCYVEDAGDPVFTVAPAYEVLWEGGGGLVSTAVYCGGGGASSNCSVLCVHCCLVKIMNPCC